MGKRGEENGMRSVIMGRNRMICLIAIGIHLPVCGGIPNWAPEGPLRSAWPPHFYLAWSNEASLEPAALPLRVFAAFGLANAQLAQVGLTLAVLEDVGALCKNHLGARLARLPQTVERNGN